MIYRIDRTMWKHLDAMPLPLALHNRMSIAKKVWCSVARLSSPFEITAVTEKPTRLFEGQQLMPKILSPIPAARLLLTSRKGTFSPSPPPHQAPHKRGLDEHENRLDASLEHLDGDRFGEPAHTIYNVTVPRYVRVYGAAKALPDYLDPRIQQGILMTNMCDWSVYTMREVVWRLAAVVDPKINVEWMNTISRPREMFKINNRTPATYHSVLLLTTAAGQRFVLDLTGEQYGFPAEHAFLPWHQYQHRYVERRGRWSGFAVRRVSTQDEYRELQRSIKIDPDLLFWELAREQVLETAGQWTRMEEKGDLTMMVEEELRRRVAQRIVFPAETFPWWRFW